jgi:transposase
MPTAISEERKTQVYELALTGKTIRQIATELGIGKSTAHAALKEAIAEIPPTERAERRALADDRYNKWLVMIHQEIDQRDGDPAKLIPIAVSIEAQRARLFGLNEEEADNKNLVRQVEISWEMANLIKEAEKRAEEKAEADRKEILGE